MLFRFFDFLCKTIQLPCMREFMQRHKGRQFMASAEEGDIYGDECYSLDKTPRANSEARLNKKVNFIFILIQKHCSVNSSSFSSFFVSSHLPGDTLE